ncbi:unnamed protein product, partial [Didymodactylos carnosus]
IQSINTVLLFSVDDLLNPAKLIYVKEHSNGKSLGFGKSVTWLENGNKAVLLANYYSIVDYAWSSSQIQIYDNNLSALLSHFPNNYQTLSSYFNPSFLNIISTSTSLIIVDITGNIQVIQPTPPGYYAATSTSDSDILTYSAQVPCTGGMFKNQTSLEPCLLCPIGTKASSIANIECTPCSSLSFCPFGSVNDVSYTKLEPIIPHKTYPNSPDNSLFDDILIQNMFSIGTTGR